MIVNIGITSKNRLPHLKKCIKSLEENTLCDYNLFIADDGSDKNIIDYLYSGKIKNLKQVFLRPEPAGITHNFDLLFKYSEYHQWYFNQDENDLFCYLQDDTEIIQKGWLTIMNDAYNELMTANKISLFGGFDSKFHNTIRTIKWREHNVKIKCSSCGVNIIGRHGVFDRIGLPHRIDYDGKPRGFPSPIPGQKKGRGSNFDTYLFGMAHNSQTGEWPKGAGGVNSLSRQDKYYMCFDFIKHTANTKKESSWGNKY